MGGGIRYDLGFTKNSPPLLIPEQLEGVVEQGRRVYDLVIQRGRHDFGLGEAVLTLGYNGAILGPTLRARLGDTFVVNGQLQPHVVVEAKQVRFRVLNGSNARVYRFAFRDGSTFQLIGGDNSLLEAPVEVSAVVLSPGERVELVIDLEARLGDALRLVDTFTGVQLFELRVELEPERLTALPERLVTLERADPADAVVTRRFELSMSMGRFTINGASMDMDVINERVPVDQVEIWRLSNTSMMTHSFHMHATHYEVLRRNGRTPPPHERGFKDTVRLEPDDVVEVLVRHRDYTDERAPYMYHCHILEHEDRGMMGQFVVV